MTADIYGRPECNGCAAVAARLVAAGVVFRVHDLQSFALAELADHDQPIDNLPRVALWLDQAEAVRVVDALERTSAMTGPGT